MCYAIPGKIEKIIGDNAMIDFEGVKKEANISIVDAKVGDYVLVHAGFAIEKLTEQDAEKSLKLIKEFISKIDNAEQDG